MHNALAALRNVIHAHYQALAMFEKVHQLDSELAQYCAANDAV